MGEILVGDVFDINSGGSVTVLEVNGWDKIKIEHNDEHKYTIIVNVVNLRKGSLRNPKHYLTYDGKWINRYDLCVDMILENNRGDKFTIVKMNLPNYATIEFNDKTKYTYIVSLERILLGAVVNPYSRNVYGKGYIGVGVHAAVYTNGRQSTTYTKWSAMLKRCYSDVSRHEYRGYIDCEVCDEWLNYQVFAQWCHDTGYLLLGYHLDKDLLVRGNKMYSPETCCMLPGEINSVLIESRPPTIKSEPRGITKRQNGQYYVRTTENSTSTPRGTYDTLQEAMDVYRKITEVKIKTLALKYRYKISKQAYTALLNWQIK